MKRLAKIAAAAHDLQEYVRKISGAELPIVGADANPTGALIYRMLHYMQRPLLELHHRMLFLRRVEGRSAPKRRRIRRRSCMRTS